MAVLTITQLKALWIDGFIPDQDDYVDLFDTMESLGAGVPANLQSVLTAGGYAEVNGDNYFDLNLGTGNGDGYFDAFFKNGGESLNAFFDNTSFSVENFVSGVGTNVLVIDGTGFRITQKTGANTINLKFDTPTESGDVLIPSKAGTIALLSDIGGATPPAGVNQAGTINYYDTGSFNPVLVDAGGGGSYTVSQNIANYTRIGNVVHVDMFLNVINTSGTPSGQLRITGLPFTPEVSAMFSVVNVEGATGGTNFNQITAFADRYSSIINFFIQQATDNNLDTPFNAAVFSGGRIRLSGSYIFGESE